MDPSEGLVWVSASSNIGCAELPVTTAHLRPKADEGRSMVQLDGLRAFAFLAVMCSQANEDHATRRVRTVYAPGRKATRLSDQC